MAAPNSHRSTTTTVEFCSQPKKVGRRFYARSSVVDVAKDLLGKILCSNIDGNLAKVMITETEAYAGTGDKASHAYGGKRTKRTEPMYSAGGVAYVYLCYGIHHLFNVVTSVKDIPHAVLIRAGSIVEGESAMLARRGKLVSDKSLLAGPGSLAKALGITTAFTGASLSGKKLWIEDIGMSPTPANIQAGPRIGIDYAQEDAALPYRFVLRSKTTQESK